MSFVLDASLTLAWCFQDEGTKFTASVLGALERVGAAAPTVWLYEVTNGLRTAQKSKRLSEDGAASFVRRLLPLPIDLMLLDRETMLGDLRRTALDHNLTAYDASYLVLAKRLRVPLGTLDGTGRRLGLKHAAHDLGVALLSEEQIGVWAAEVRKDRS